MRRCLTLRWSVMCMHLRVRLRRRRVPVFAVLVRVSGCVLRVVVGAVLVVRTVVRVAAVEWREC